MVCQNCKAELPANALFCPYCGIKAENAVYQDRCSTCGNDLSSDALFCPFCGNQRHKNAPSFPAMQNTENLIDFHCPHCGTQIDPRTNCCPECYGHIERPHFEPTPNSERCPNCGNTVESYQAFCPICKHHLLENKSAQHASDNEIYPHPIVAIILSILAIMCYGLPWVNYFDLTGFELLESTFKAITEFDSLPSFTGIAFLVSFLSSIITVIFSAFSIKNLRNLLGSIVLSILGIFGNALSLIELSLNISIKIVGIGNWLYLSLAIASLVASIKGYSKRYN